MPDAATCADRWRERIARAQLLATEHPTAATILTFYGRLAEYQSRLALRIRTRPATSFAEAIDVTDVVSAVPAFLDWLSSAAPTPLATAASGLARSTKDWPPLVRERLSAAPDVDNADPANDDDQEDGEEGLVPEDAAARFAVDAVLQPHAEMAAASLGAEHADRLVGGLTASCPVCASAPSVGVLREDGHGARRMLVCARCLTEWAYRRVVCTSCGEEEFDRLPVYTADAWPHVRVEACDRCKRYLKTIDLSKNGLAVPVVDDVASVSLDLWAQQSGYRRLRANLLGL